MQVEAARPWCDHMNGVLKLRKRACINSGLGLHTEATSIYGLEAEVEAARVWCDHPQTSTDPTHPSDLPSEAAFKIVTCLICRIIILMKRGNEVGDYKEGIFNCVHPWTPRGNSVLSVTIEIPPSHFKPCRPALEIRNKKGNFTIQSP